LAAAAILLCAGAAQASFTETYEPGTADVGNWLTVTSDNAPRVIETSGGSPGGYLRSQASRAVPSWATASTRYQPGYDDEFKRDSVYTGDWTGAGVTSLSMDLNVFSYGAWTADRALTLELQGWDAKTDMPSFDATLTIVELPEPLSPGWNHYSFAIDAASKVIPTGWVVTREDGTPATDADWSQMLHQVDMVAVEYGKPGYFYPSLGVWDMGIDNVDIETTAPVPEPASGATLALGLGVLAAWGRRKARR
jgi:hypothetical protein